MTDIRPSHKIKFYREHGWPVGRVSAGRFMSGPLHLPRGHKCEVEECPTDLEFWFVLKRCWRWIGAA